MEVNVKVFNTSSSKKLPNKKLHNIVEDVLLNESKSGGFVNVIILDDSEIHEMNKKFLNHDYPTDVISFSLGDGAEIEGEIYISVDTARRQAIDYKVSLTNELMRLAAHGALHLAGYDDSDIESRTKMSELENKYLQQ